PGNASCHQTIVNAVASCRRAGGEKCLDRRVGRLCHRRNFSQSLFSVAVSLSVSCIVLLHRPAMASHNSLPLRRLRSRESVHATPKLIGDGRIRSERPDTPMLWRLRLAGKRAFFSMGRKEGRYLRRGRLVWWWYGVPRHSA